MADGRLWLHDITGGPGGRVRRIRFSPLLRHGRDRSPPAAGTSVMDDDVRFTVYRPQALSPGIWASLLVFAHKTDLVEEPGQPPLDPNERVEAIARAHFGNTPVRQSGEDARSGSSAAPGCGSPRTCPAIACNPANAEFDWWEPVHHVEFRLLATPDLVGSVVRGAVRIWCGPLIIGEVSLAIRVTASDPAAAPAVAESAPRYRKIFPSYSHADGAIVDGFAEIVRTFGDEYLQDVVALRSGERWRERLPELIEEADVFQLFWSSNSMRSPYCREEWEHALALDGRFSCGRCTGRIPCRKTRPWGCRPLPSGNCTSSNTTLIQPGRTRRPIRARYPAPAPARALPERSPGHSGGRSGGRHPRACAPASEQEETAHHDGFGRCRATVFVLAIATQTLLAPKSHPGAIASPTPSSAQSATASANPIGSPALSRNPTGSQPSAG